MLETYSIPGFSEPFNSISHLLAAVVFFIMSVPLLKSGRGNILKLITLSVFSFAGVFMLSMSGVYHLLSPGGMGSIVMQRLDHSAIFVLIVATMTPIHQILFKGFMRWGWIIIIWSIAITSLTLKTIFFTSFPEWIGLVLFLSLGWLGAVSGAILWFKKDLAFIGFLVLGGLSYTAGAVLEFLQMPVVIPGIIRAHELFHVAVIIGLFSHWKFIYDIANMDDREPKKK